MLPDKLIIKNVIKSDKTKNFETLDLTIESRLSIKDCFKTE